MQDEYIIHALDPAGRRTATAVKKKLVQPKAGELLRAGYVDIRVGDLLEEAMPVEVWLVGLGLVSWRSSKGRQLR